MINNIPNFRRDQVETDARCVWILLGDTVHTALRPHAHSSPFQGFSPAPYGAKTAYGGGDYELHS